APRQRPEAPAWLAGPVPHTSLGGGHAALLPHQRSGLSRARTGAAAQAAGTGVRMQRARELLDTRRTSAAASVIAHPRFCPRHTRPGRPLARSPRRIHRDDGTTPALLGRGPNGTIRAQRGSLVHGTVLPPCRQAAGGNAPR